MSYITKRVNGHQKNRGQWVEPGHFNIKSSGRQTASSKERATGEAKKTSENCVSRRRNDQLLQMLLHKVTGHIVFCVL